MGGIGVMGGILVLSTGWAKLKLGIFLKLH